MNREYWLIIIGFVGLVSLFFWFVVFTEERAMENRIQRQRERARIQYQHGYEAYQAGVPAEANPSRSQSWLDGWIDAKGEENHD